jgi:hypothetical protein
MLVSIELGTNQVMHDKFNIVEMLCIICKVHVEWLHLGFSTRLGIIYKVYVEFLHVKISMNSMNGLPSLGHHLFLLQIKHIKKCSLTYHCYKGIANWTKKKKVRDCLPFLGHYRLIRKQKWFASYYYSCNNLSLLIENLNSVTFAFVVETSALSCWKLHAYN